MEWRPLIVKHQHHLVLVDMAAATSNGSVIDTRRFAGEQHVLLLSVSVKPSTSHLCDGAATWLLLRVRELQQRHAGTSSLCCCAVLDAAGVQVGRRGEEARDMARYALRNPWWSLSNFAATRAASELQGGAKQVHWQLSEAATAASTAQVTGFNYKEPKTEQQVRHGGRLQIFFCWMS